MERFKVRPTIEGNVRRFVTPKRDVVVSSREVNGRSVVFYVDAPTGTSGSVLDLSKVNVTPK
jgi:hypothetical protein